MSKSQSVLLITGPSGAGKSSVSRQLATNLGQCVEIDIESINYMLVDGFNTVAKNDQEVIEFNEWELSADTISNLVKHLAKHDYNVVIHGHVTNEFIEFLERKTFLSGKFLLLPTVETALTRDQQRGNRLTMGDAMVKEHYQYFIDSNFENFIQIDSTNMTIDETVTKIKALALK